MPITGPSSYITVVPAFLNHWTDVQLTVNPVELDGGALGQPGDVGRAYLQDLYDDLLGARDTLEGVLLDAALERAGVLSEKTWLRDQCVFFNKAVRADHGTTPFAAALPLAPGLADARERFNRPIRLLTGLWGKVNAYRTALTPSKPLLVLSPSGASQADATGRLGSLVDHQDAFEERDQQATLDRARREDLQDRIYPVLKLYRMKVESLFPPGNALVVTLPALTDDGTAGPEPGALTGSLNQAGTAVTLAGTPSPSATVVRHQLRASVGDEPNGDDETMRAEFAAGQAIALTTDYGLGAPGAKVHWRLLAVTADGHESATPWLTFQRPV